MISFSNKEIDLGYELSCKSVEEFDNGNYLEAIFIQTEIFESIIPLLISGRSKTLGKDKNTIKKMAYKGNLERKIDNLIELCGEEFNFLTRNLHNYRQRRNKIIHKKTEFKNMEELKIFAKDTWILGTLILSQFTESIKNFPI